MTELIPIKMAVLMVAAFLISCGEKTQEITCIFPQGKGWFFIEHSRLPVSNNSYYYDFSRQGDRILTNQGEYYEGIVEYVFLTNQGGGVRNISDFNLAVGRTGVFDDDRLPFLVSYFYLDTFSNSNNPPNDPVEYYKSIKDIKGFD